MRLCARCKTEQSDENFYSRIRVYKSGNSKKVIASYCKPCHNKVSTIAVNSTKGRATSRRGRLRREYGFSPEAYDKLFAAQNYGCAICGESKTEHTNARCSALCIDHDHVTGKVRGILCRLCNIGIGAFRDNTGLLLKTIDYLKRSVSDA
jgi:hypothetical protein